MGGVAIECVKSECGNGGMICGGLPAIGVLVLDQPIETTVNGPLDLVSEGGIRQCLLRSKVCSGTSKCGQKDAWNDCNKMAGFHFNGEFDCGVAGSFKVRESSFNVTLMAVFKGGIASA